MPRQFIEMRLRFSTSSLPGKLFKYQTLETPLLRVLGLSVLTAFREQHRQLENFDQNI